MTTYVFMNAPVRGHVNPTLAVVQELVQRGERVIYYLTEEYRTTIEATGAEFRGYESQMGNLGQPGNGTGSKQLTPLPVMLVIEAEKVLPQVMERVRGDQPDFILYDAMCLSAKIVARALHIPAILFRPNYASNDHFNPGRMMRSAQGGASGALSGLNFLLAFQKMNTRLAKLCRTYGVKPFSAQEGYMGNEDLNIIFTPREFQPAGETFNPEHYVFVGPSIQPRHDASDFPLEQLKDRPVLFISLGTVFNNQAAFYNMCFTAFKEEPWQVVLSTGSQIDPASLDPIPVNFLVRPTVPQLEVLQKASLFVTHYGMNSTMESLYYGVPMVGLPQMPEQMMTGQRIKELGLGAVLDINMITVGQLHDTVKAAFSNADFLKNAQAMQQHVRDAGGYQRAADAIMNYPQKSGRTTV